MAANYEVQTVLEAPLFGMAGVSGAAGAAERRCRRRHLDLTNLIEGDWLWLLEHHPILVGLEAEDLQRLKELVVLFLEKKKIWKRQKPKKVADPKLQHNQK